MIVFGGIIFSVLFKWIIAFIMLKTYIKTIIIALCIIACHCTSAQNHVAELDTIMQKCVSTFATPIGIVKSNYLIHKAIQYNNIEYICKAYNLKTRAYLAMAMYDRTIAFADSIEEHTDIKTICPLQFDNILIQKASAYLMVGQTERCMSTLQPIYQSVKDIIENKDLPQKQLTEGLQIYVTSLKLMSVACFLSKQYEQANTFIDQALDMCKQHSAELYTNFIDVAYIRYYNMGQIAEIEGGTDELNKYICRFEQEIKQFIEYTKKYNHPADITKENVLFYNFIVKCGRLNVAIKQHDIENASSIIRSLDSIYAVSAQIKSRSYEFYAAKADYYQMIGEYEKALAFNDSVIRRFNTMSSSDNEYYYIKKRIEIHYEAGLISDDAYSIVKRLQELADTIVKQCTTTSTQELSVKMNADQMSNALKAEQEATKRWTTIAISAIVAAIALCVALIVSLQRRK